MGYRRLLPRGHSCRCGGGNEANPTGIVRHMSFDTLAPHYRWMEFVLAGGKLQRCRTAFLKETVDAKNVLLLGEGNGRFLVAARRAMPEARITCVDSSSRMLQLARQRLLETGLSDCRVEFVRANLLDGIHLRRRSRISISSSRISSWIASSRVSSPGLSNSSPRLRHPPRIGCWRTSGKHPQDSPGCGAESSSTPCISSFVSRRAFRQSG